MSNKFEIKSSNFPYDMSAWCTEKSENIVSEVAQLVDVVKNRNDLPDDFKEELNIFLHSILWDATKLLAFSCGVEWSNKDSNLVSEKGYAGYEDIAVKYNLLEETTEAKKKKGFSLFIGKFKEYLEGERYPGRTFIHELLHGWRKFNHPIIEELFNLTEKVTMGEISWDTYTQIAKSKIKNLNFKDLTKN